MIKAHACLLLVLVIRSGDVLVVFLVNSGVTQALWLGKSGVVQTVWLAQEVLFASRDAAWLLRGGFAC